MNLAEENKALASSIFSQMSPGGMIGGYCEDGFPLFFANDALVKLLGYETYWFQLLFWIRIHYNLSNA